MKKTLVSILIGLFVIGLNGTIWAGSQKPTTAGPPFSSKPANVITVAQSGGDFTTITDALASLPDPNTTPVVVKVMPGTYTESISMKSNINLQGSGRDVTTIVGNIVVAWGTTVTDVTISGFKISGGNIKSDGSVTPDQKVTITGNYLTGSSGEALSLYGCSPYFIVSDNIITGNQRGISMAGCRANIRNNTITGNSGNGIQNWGGDGGFSSDALIVGNVISGNAIGIRNTGFTTAMIKDNVIDSNSGFGISNYNAAPSISGNRITKNGNSGIYIENPNLGASVEAAISNNVISGNGTSVLYSAGIEAFWAAGYTLIEGNIIENNPSGTQLANLSLNTIIKNNVVRKNITNGLNAGGAILLTGNQVTGNNTSQSYGDSDLEASPSTVLIFNVFDSTNLTPPFTGSFNSKSNRDIHLTQLDLG